MIDDQVDDWSEKFSSSTWAVQTVQCSSVRRCCALVDVLVIRESPFLRKHGWIHPPKWWKLYLELYLDHIWANNQQQHTAPFLTLQCSDRVCSCFFFLSSFSVENEMDEWWWVKHLLLLILNDNVSLLLVKPRTFLESLVKSYKRDACMHARCSQAVYS